MTPPNSIAGETWSVWLEVEKPARSLRARLGRTKA